MSVTDTDIGMETIEPSTALSAVALVVAGVAFFMRTRTNTESTGRKVDIILERQEASDKERRHEHAAHTQVHNEMVKELAKVATVLDSIDRRMNGRD